MGQIQIFSVNNSLELSKAFEGRTRTIFLSLYFGTYNLPNTIDSLKNCHLQNMPFYDFLHNFMLIKH